LKVVDALTGSITQPLQALADRQEHQEVKVSVSQ
jgi:hypothetical protein